jgi:hypothetical protein
MLFKNSGKHDNWLDALKDVMVYGIDIYNFTTYFSRKMNDYADEDFKKDLPGKLKFAQKVYTFLQSIKATKSLAGYGF